MGPRLRTLVGSQFVLLAAAGLLAGRNAHADVLDDYVLMQTGSFSSAEQARRETGYDAVTWHIVEIWSDGDPGERWLYTECWADTGRSPYMQRITRLRAGPDGTVTATRYVLPDAARYAGAWRDPSRFADLMPAALVELAGCDLTIARVESGRFEGATLGNRCRNSYKGASYATSQSTLTADEMVNWDRGFDAAGNLVWGPPAGPYRLQRVVGQRGTP